MAEKLEGDELIAYGFKRLIEEIRELAGEIRVLTSSVDGLAFYISNAGDNAKETTEAVKRLYEGIGKVEHNTFMMNDSLMSSASALEAIKANTFTAEMNCIRMAQELRKEQSDGEKRMGGV